MNRLTTGLEMLFSGLDTILTGIILPIILSFFASLVQVALFDWRGIKQFAANFCVSMYLALLTHWFLLKYDMPGEYKTIIISFASLTSFQTLRFLVSKKFLLILISLLGKRIHNLASNWLGVNLPDDKIKEITNSIADGDENKPQQKQDTSQKQQ